MIYLNDFNLFTESASNEASPKQKAFIDRLRGDIPVLVFQYTTEEEKKAIILWMTRSGFKDNIKSKGIDILIIKADKEIFYVGEDPKNTTVLYKKGKKLKEFFGVYLLRQAQQKWNSLAKEVEAVLMEKPSPEKWLKGSNTAIVFLYDKIADRPLFSKFIDAYKTMMRVKYNYFKPSVEFVAINLRDTPDVVDNKEEREAQGLGSLRDDRTGKLRVESLPRVGLWTKTPWETNSTLKNTVDVSKTMSHSQLEKKAFKLIEDFVSFM